jgi:hypothetical protein
MAARKTIGTKNVPWDTRTRDRIKASMLINRLSDFVEHYRPLGENEDTKAAEAASASLKHFMTDGQIRAALGLLKKVLPDLASTEISGEITHSVDQLSTNELERIAASGRARVIEASPGD